MSERKVYVSTPLRRQVMERDGSVCVKCGSTNDLSIDHVLPEALGGPTTADNLQVLCMTCNVSKGDRVTVQTINGRQMMRRIQYPKHSTMDPSVYFGAREPDPGEASWSPNYLDAFIDIGPAPTATDAE